MPEEVELEQEPQESEPEPLRCDLCNEAVEPGELVHFHGIHEEEIQDLDICQECSEETTECGECGRPVSSDGGLVYLEGWGTYCSYECANENCFVCDDCSEWHHNEEAADTGDTVVCQACLESSDRADACAHCGSWVYDATESGRYVENRSSDNYICDVCLIRVDIHECENCGEYRDDVRQYYDLDTEEPYRYCTDCAEEQELDSDFSDRIGSPFEVASRDSPTAAGRYQVLNYSYKPDFKYLATDKEAIAVARARGINRALFYMGTEVEVQVRERDVGMSAATKHLFRTDTRRIFYLKSDSSIGYGFELVTHPFTWGWAMENLDAFDPIFELGEWCEAYDNGACGMHVHMNRQAFTEYQLYKFATFFYNNVPFIRRLSRRVSEDRWRAYSSPVLRARLMDCVKRRNDVGSRGMLNFSGRSTIECRAFNSTLTKGGFFGNLEFLKAVYDWTKTAPMTHLVPEAFMEFVEEHNYKHVKTLVGATSMPPAIEE